MGMMGMGMQQQPATDFNLLSSPGYVHRACMDIEGASSIKPFVILVYIRPSMLSPPPFHLPPLLTGLTPWA